MMLMAAILAAALTSPSAPATDDASRAAVEAYIQQCERDWAQGAVVDNSATTGTFIADDYHGVGSSGKVVSRADMVAPYAPKGKAAGLYYAKVHFTTPVLAIVQGEEWWDEASGERHHLIWTDTWLFRNGKWQIVASQDSRIPADQPLQN